jgi:hypothetical protein
MATLTDTRADAAAITDRAVAQMARPLSGSLGGARGAGPSHSGRGGRGGRGR